MYLLCILYYVMEFPTVGFDSTAVVGTDLRKCYEYKMYFGNSEYISFTFTINEQIS